MAVLIDEQEFNALEFNIVNERTLAKMKERHPGLFVWPEMDKSLPATLSKVKVLKYIVMCYDKNSPIVKMENNILKRKRISAEIAEFEQDSRTNEFKKAYRDVMEGKNNKVNEMIIKFVIHQHDLLYSQYVSLCESYYQLYYFAITNSLELGDNVDVVKVIDSKTKVNRQLKELAKEIDSMYEEIFLKDKSIENSVYAEIDTHMTEIPIGFPEIYAGVNEDEW